MLDFIFVNFSEKFFISIALFLILTLILINSTIFSLINLCTIFIILLFTILAQFNKSIFGLFLLLAEVHVFYVISCLALTWVRYDAVNNSSIVSSKLLHKAMLYIFIIIVCTYTVISGNILKTYFFNIDTYTQLLLMSDYANFYNNFSVTNLATYSYIATMYLTTMSLEFIILNIFMFVIVIVVFYIKNVSSRAIINSETRSIMLLTRILFSENFIVRQQNQAVQLAKKYKISCLMKKTMVGGCKVQKAVLMLKNK